MKFSLSACAAIAALCFAQLAEAATVSITPASRPASQSEVDDPGSGGLQADSIVHEFFVTTDGDILRVGDLNIDVALYNNPAGSDTMPPNPLFLPVFPSLGADSFITTPGDTATAGGGLSDQGASFFDSSNDGPQNNFLFARLTTAPGEGGTFSGVISVAGSAGPEVFPFSFPLGIPEPTSMMLVGLGLVGLGSVRRRS
ncbi:MAG: PEP-CTERM sorting domain-containing protein [Lacipirellulaceae bacterium]